MGNLKTHILNIFLTYRQDLVKDMERCYHAFDDDHLNPFHLENSVFTHTLMVLNKVDMDSEDELVNLAKVVCAICHDIGKIRTRNSIDEKQKVTFYNHEYASIQYAVDFIYRLEVLGEITVFERNELIKICLPVISNHLDAFKRNFSYDDFIKYNNGNPIIAELLLSLMKADSDGRFCLKDDKQEMDSQVELLKYYLSNFKFNPVESNSITIVGGSTGSGKDYIASNVISDNGNTVIISFDQIRVELFKAHNFIPAGASATEIYNQAFHWVNDNKVDLGNPLKIKTKEAIDAGRKVIISNTNCTRKARRKLLNILMNGLKTRIGYSMVYVVAPLDVILKRNKERVNDKCLDIKIVEQFAFNQQIPTLMEGFGCVEIIAN